MLNSFSPAVSAPACGLLAIVAVYLARGVFHKCWVMSLPSILVVFLGGSLVPAADAFISYPFLNPKPDLTQHVLYLPIAGLGLLWTVFAAIRQGVYDGR